MAPYPARMGLSEASMLVKLRSVLAKYFGKRGEAVVDANLAAVKLGESGAKEVPEALLAVFSKTTSGRA